MHSLSAETTIETPGLTVCASERELRPAIAAAKRDGRTVGVVPTMGALHGGHLSLIHAARGECGFVVVTIFVNPTQFGPNEDFREYPRRLETDLAACRDAGVDLVFHPDRAAMYPAGFSTKVVVDGLSDRLEGAFRPGHFDGVATVVLKLFQLTQPEIAYFGRKDYQQQLLIRRMCRDLNLPVEIRTCPTVREADGLAVSSRNEMLTLADRQSALALSRSLQLAQEQLRGGESDLGRVREAMRRRLEASPGVQVDYATIADPESLEELEQPQTHMIALVAARVGGVRLIDNVPIHL